MRSAARDASTLTLFCFPCAGASATYYLRWRRFVPSWLRIEPVEPPGRGLRIAEAALRDYRAAVEDLTTALLPQTREKYALFGHSMGALLAYGCAHLLPRKGAPSAAALAVAAAAAPSRRPSKSGISKSDAELVDDLRRFKGAPEELFKDEEMLRMTLDILSADYDLCDSFEPYPERLPSGSILIYGGLEDSLTEAELSAWRLESPAPSTLAMFDGGHFFLREHEDAFLRRMTRDLALISGFR